MTGYGGANSGWTDERVESLKKLWDEGLSCSQIAKRIGGITRNAVIGKANRLALSGRQRPSAPRTVKPSAPRVIGAPRPPKIARAEIKTEQLQSARPTTTVGVDSLGRLYHHVESAPLPRVRLFVAETPAVTIVELNAHVCRYPMNDGEDPTHGWLYCGADVAPAGPYCPGHRAIAVDARATEAANKRAAGRGRGRDWDIGSSRASRATSVFIR